VTLIGSSVNLLGLYAGGTPAFPGSTFAGVQVECCDHNLCRVKFTRPHLRDRRRRGKWRRPSSPHFSIWRSRSQCTRSRFSGTSPLQAVTIGFNGVVLRGQNIQAESVITGANPIYLPLTALTNGEASLGSLSNLSYFVVDYSKGVKVLGPTMAAEWHFLMLVRWSCL